MEQKKHIVVFRVNAINGYELIVERKEKFYGLEMQPKIIKMHYLNLIKELQDSISQNEKIRGYRKRWWNFRIIISKKKIDEKNK